MQVRRTGIDVDGLRAGKNQRLKLIAQCVECIKDADIYLSAEGLLASERTVGRFSLPIRPPGSRSARFGDYVNAISVDVEDDEPDDDGDEDQAQNRPGVFAPVADRWRESCRCLTNRPLNRPSFRRSPFRTTLVSYPPWTIPG
jgi:hypothetical protein